MKKIALITGVTGQDGSYLAEHLLELGYEVHGIYRKASAFTTGRIEHLFGNQGFHTHYGDLSDSSNLNRLVSTIKPTEIYNLGAQSHVGVSFEVPEYTADVTGLGTLRLLEAMRTYVPSARFYQASTSELFGGIDQDGEPQSETTPFYPKSPYAAAKLYAYWIVVNYREAYGLHASNGILFNHESPRRGRTFVTRKITAHVARYHNGQREILRLGNLDAQRDWGHAREYVEAMRLINQLPEPTDLVLGTGKTQTVRACVEAAFSCIGKEIVWRGEGESEIGLDHESGEVLVAVDPKYYRPSEVEFLLSDPSRAFELLDWKPSVTFGALIREMVESDIQGLSNGF